MDLGDADRDVADADREVRQMFSGAARSPTATSAPDKDSPSRRSSLKIPASPAPPGPVRAHPQGGKEASAGRGAGRGIRRRSGAGSTSKDNRAACPAAMRPLFTMGPAAAGIDLGRRPETLELEEWRALANCAKLSK